MYFYKIKRFKSEDTFNKMKAFGSFLKKVATDSKISFSSSTKEIGPSVSSADGILSPVEKDTKEKVRFIYIYTSTFYILLN